MLGCEPAGPGALDKSGYYVMVDKVWQKPRFLDAAYLLQADASRFAELSAGYARDSRHVWLKGHLLPDAESATFVSDQITQFPFTIVLITLISRISAGFTALKSRSSTTMSANFPGSMLPTSVS